VSFVESVPAPWSPEPDPSFASPGAAPRGQFRLHDRADPQRRAIEQFVAGVYRQHFGARLAQFMPVLVSRGGDGDPCAAAGYRSAVEPLFLERYLPAPIEQVLAEATGRPVERESIVEIGQFASQCAGEGRRLMRALGRHLLDCGFRWAVVTATADLRRLLRREGLGVLPLGTAQPHCLGDDAMRWGSYYRHAPKVLAGDLITSVACLERERR
jgi:hypothetical protein